MFKIDGAYNEREYTSAFIRLIKSCKSFVDVGADKGYYTMLAMKHMDSGIIYAFEADHTRFLLLNKILHDVKNKVVLSNKGVGKENKQDVPFYIPADKVTSGGVNRLERMRQTKTELISTITLDSLGFIPDLVKIDTEGNEDEILEGATKVLSHKKTIFMIETHGKDRKAKCINIMAKNNYKITEYKIKRKGNRLLFEPEN